MSKKLTDAKRAAIKRYDAANTRQIHLKLNCKTDAEIIEHLEKQESIQGYIKDLIRRDMDEPMPIGIVKVDKDHCFCPLCGVALDSGKEPMYCPECKTHLDWSVKYL